jgi:hypothetical protein
MKPRDFRCHYGVHIQTFNQMLAAYQQAQTIKHKTGRPAALSLEEQLLFTLEFWREYLTLFHHGFEWGIHETTALRTIQRVEDALIKSGQFALPSKRAWRDNIEFQVVIVDVAETPVERPKKSNAGSTVARRNGTQLKAK